MRYMIVAVLILAVGCAHVEPATAVATVQAHPDPMKCDLAGAHIPVRLTVKHYGFSPLIFTIDGEEGPPYSINWVYYKVYARSSSDLPETIDYQHGPGGHGTVSVTRVTLSHGDTTDLIADMYGIQQKDAKSIYRIGLEDTSGRIFMSQPFGVCGAGFTPN
jgi:hypothetical protein